MAETLKPDQREEWTRQAWELRVMRGWSESRIAEKFNVNKSTVSRWLKRVRDERRAEFSQALEDHKAEQVARLTIIAEQAYEGWLRTCDPAEIERETEKENGGVTETTSMTEKRYQSGDPAMLAQYRGALADMRDILGLNAPKAEASAAEVIVKVYRGVDADLV